MSQFEESRRRLKLAFCVVTVVLAIVLPLVWPLLNKIEWIAKASLSPIQVLYTTIAVELTLAVYVWGVGNWSRFEPPRDTGATPVGQQGTPGQAAVPSPPPAGGQ